MKNPLENKSPIESVKKIGETFLKERFVSLENLKEATISREFFLLAQKKMTKKLHKVLKTMTSELRGVDSRLLAVDKKLGQVKASLDRLSVPAFRSDQRMQELEEKIDELVNMVEQAKEQLVVQNDLLRTRIDLKAEANAEALAQLEDSESEVTASAATELAATDLSSSNKKSAQSTQLN